MKFYYFPVAPNPTKVRTYLREKGIELEEIEVNLGTGEQNSAEHLARNPKGALPVLELDDGTYITESLPMMEYLEELHPEPPMIGTNATQRARVRERERMAEANILNPVARLVHATNSPIGLPPNPEIAAAEKERFATGCALMEELIADGEFVCDWGPTIADCTLFAGLFMGEFFGVNVPEDYPNIRRWYAAFKERPSTAI